MTSAEDHEKINNNQSAETSTTETKDDEKIINIQPVATAANSKAVDVKMNNNLSAVASSTATENDENSGDNQSTVLPTMTSEIIENGLNNQFIVPSTDHALSPNGNRTPVESSYVWEEETEPKSLSSMHNGHACVCKHLSTGLSSSCAMETNKFEHRCGGKEHGKHSDRQRQDFSAYDVQQVTKVQCECCNHLCLSNGVDQLTLSPCREDSQNPQNLPTCLLNGNSVCQRHESVRGEGVSQSLQDNDLNNPLSNNLRASLKHTKANRHRKGFAENDLRYSNESVEDNSAQV